MVRCIEEVIKKSLKNQKRNGEKNEKEAES